MKNCKKIRIIGAPYHYGRDSAIHSDAPNAIRKFGLHESFKIAGWKFTDDGDINVGPLLHDASPLFTKLKFLPEVLDQTIKLKKRVSQTLENHEVPVVIGGDHSVAIGSLLGAAAFNDDITVIWIDTHGDFHTSKTTPSGRLHGMALALSLGLDRDFCKLLNPDTHYVKKNRAIMFGVQKFDPGEREQVTSNISLIDMHDVVGFGIGKTVQKLLQRIHTKHIHISLDLDSIDKQYAPGTDMAIDGALTYRELMYLLAELSKHFDVSGMDVVEYEPANDIEGKTAKLAIETITTALGEQIGTYEMYMHDIVSIF